MGAAVSSDFLAGVFGIATLGAMLFTGVAAACWTAAWLWCLAEVASGDRRDKAAWLLLLVLFPVFGAFLYELSLHKERRGATGRRPSGVGQFP